MAKQGYPKWNYTKSYLEEAKKSGLHADIYKQFSYPRNVVFTVEEGRERTFNSSPATETLTEAQRKLFYIRC